MGRYHCLPHLCTRKCVASFGALLKGKLYEIMYMHRYDTTFNGGITIGEGPIAYCAQGITVGEGFIAYLRFVQFQNINVHPLHVSYCRSFSVVQIDQVQLLLHSTQVKPCTVNKHFGHFGMFRQPTFDASSSHPYKPAAISPSHVPKRHFTRPGTMLAGATWQGRGCDSNRLH